MKITLYKNCCLNDKYQEVFYNTKLETYLNSLTKLSLTLNNVFYENDMEIVFDYDILTSEGLIIRIDNIYDFNYVKIEEINGSALQPDLVRYCFIKHIEVKNGCVYVETEEDVWASFSAKMQGTNTCVLINSRKTAYGSGAVLSPLELPYNYDGNNKLEIESLSYGAGNPQVYMLVEFQLYDLNTYSRPDAEREVFYAIVKQVAYAETINILELKAKILMSKMATKLIRGKSYQIGNIYAIPYGLLSLSDFVQEDEELFEDLVMRESLNTKEHIILTATLANNYKNLFIGVLDNYITLKNNGTSIPYEVKFSSCSAGISLKLNCSNQIIDITNSFKYDVPFQGILSEEYATRKISNDMDWNKLANQKEQTQIHSILGIGKSSFSLFDAAFGNNPFGSMSNFLSNIETTVMGMKGVGGGKQQLYDMQQWAIKAPKYSNSKGVISNLNSIATICYGLIVGKINPDNNTFVKAFVDNYGYSCYLFINSQSLFESILKTDLYNSENFHYNIVKISSPNIYGSFTNDIANKLNEILSNGVKIWYDETRTLDPYTNGLLN